MSIDQTIYTDYIDRLLSGKKYECSLIVQQLIDNNVDIRDIYLNLFQKSLYHVGELWETNRVSVSTEHIATAITESLLTLLYPKIFSQNPSSRKAVVTSCVNEYHQIGGKMVADIFELNGWNTNFLGANTPIDHLLRHLDEFRPDVLALSLSLYANLPRLLKTIDVISTNNSKLDIVVGGQAFNWGGTKKLANAKNIQYYSNLLDFEKAIN